MKYKNLFEAYNRLISENALIDSGSTLENKKETNLQLKNVDIKSKEIKGCTFKTVDFVTSQFSYCKVNKTTFDDFVFDYFNVNRTTFKDCKFINGDRMDSIIRDRSEFINCSFKKCNRLSLKFELGGLTKVDFDDCKINSLEISKGSLLTDVTFKNCFIGNVKFYSDSKVKRIKFINCKFDSPRIEGYLKNIDGVEVK